MLNQNAFRPSLCRPLCLSRDLLPSLSLTLPRLLFLVLAVAILSSVAGSGFAAPLDYYLPAGQNYDSAVPDPESILGYEVGEWHARPDQLVEYCRVVEGASDRVVVDQIGRTHESRPVVVAYISSADNIARLDEIRQRHASLSESGGPSPGGDDPVVVYLGYSIHGNESSGSNAGLLALYHYAASRSDEVQELLENTVIILDPCMNPDGLGRFAHWANSNRSLHPNPNPIDREHNEAWPGGRTNHYTFDLNRDWLLAVHPESRARLGVFQAWRPNVLSDFHEMGSDATYFFQPGVPSRKNPLTPEENVRFTERMATFHRKALDEIGSLYYSEERFDDFYYGKGSTYPDVQGCIGILFEQASSRGHNRDSINGTFDFAFTVRNQFLTSLSTVEGAHAMRSELLEYQHRFYRDAMNEAKKSSIRGWIFGDAFDPARTDRMLDLVLQHGVEVFELDRATDQGGQRFEPGSAYVIPMEQRQSRLLRGMMDRSTSFSDSIFYDVSAWTIPLAMGLPYSETTSVSGLLGDRVTEVPSRAKTFDATTAAYAYAFTWDSYWAPRALGRLLQSGVRARVATSPFTGVTTSGERALGRGTIVIPTSIQDVDSAELRRHLEEIAREDGIEILSLTTGGTPVGIDLGSPSLRHLPEPKVLLAVDSGTSSYEAGAIWHLLDHRHGLRVTRVSQESLPDRDLHEYTHIILPSGGYGSWSEEQIEKLSSWVGDGGTFIAVRNAVNWVLSQEWVKSERRDRRDLGPENKEYADAAARSDARRLSGAIFEGEIDETHPLAYGYRRPTLPVFRNHRNFIDPSGNPYANVVQLRGNPLLAGYLHKSQRTAVAGSASLIAERKGSGLVVLMVDDPTFRGFWYGTNKLLLNSIFFSRVVDRTGG